MPNDRAHAPKILIDCDASSQFTAESEKKHAEGCDNSLPPERLAPGAMAEAPGLRDSANTGRKARSLGPRSAVPRWQTGSLWSVDGSEPGIVVLHRRGSEAR